MKLLLATFLIVTAYRIRATAVDARHADAIVIESARHFSPPRPSRTRSPKLPIARRSHSTLA